MKLKEAESFIRKINEFLHGLGFEDFIGKCNAEYGGSVEDKKNHILITFASDHTGNLDKNGERIVSVTCALMDKVSGKAKMIFKTTKSPDGIENSLFDKIKGTYEETLHERAGEDDAKRHKSHPDTDDHSTSETKEGGFVAEKQGIDPHPDPEGSKGDEENVDPKSPFFGNEEIVKKIISSSFPWTLAKDEGPMNDCSTSIYCYYDDQDSFILAVKIGWHGCLVIKAIQGYNKLLESVYFKSFLGFAKCFRNWLEGLNIVKGFKEKMAKEKEKKACFAGDIDKGSSQTQQLPKSKIFGYIRVSTSGQSIDRQKEEMLADGIAEKDLYIDYASGKDFDRPQYQAMKKALRKGDTVFFDSLDRLGRNYDEMKKEWLSLEYDLGVDLVCLDPKMMDTREFKKYPDSMRRPIEDLVLGILSWKSSNERSDILRRQAQGIAIAKAKGKYRGRIRRKDPEEFSVLCRQVSEGSMKASFAMKKIGMTKATFFRHYADWKKANGIK